MCVFSDTLKYLYLFILAASGMDILTQTKHFANANVDETLIDIE